MNVLPVTIDALHAGDGPAVMVRLRAGDGFLLARVTKRSVQALTLEPGRPVWAVVKTTAFAHGDVGTARPNAKA
ncbi:MAG: TOBE domain-containing protein [Pseudomonadota bacterium]